MGGKPLAAEDAGTRDMISEVLQDDEPKDDRGVRRTILDLIVWLEAEVARMEPRVAEPEKLRGVLCVWCGEGIPYHGDEDKTAVYELMKAHDRTCPKNPLVARIAELEALLARVRAPEHGSLTVKPDGDGDVARI